MSKYREVKCPGCGHQFVWLVAPHGNSYYLYRRKGVDEELFSTPCPKCSLDMVIPDDVALGIDIKDNTVELRGSVRGL